MLNALHVHNFALLEDVKADFTEGFNIFTGETGSGKSILIDAFGLVLGGRGSVDFIRKGTDSLWVQAVFDISGLPQLQELLQEQGIEAEEELFLKRQLNISGKSKSFVNGIQVPLSFLKQLGTALVDIHGQHENQALLKPEAARIAVDIFGGPELEQLLDEYQTIYGQYMETGKKLQALQLDDNNRERLLDRYAWEIREIRDSGIKLGEEEQLQEEAKLLQHGEKIIRQASFTHGLLEKDRGILELLADSQSSLNSVCSYDKRLESIASALENAWNTLEDCRLELGDYLAGNEFNPERAEEVQQRLDLYYKLHKKYGGSTEKVLEYLQQAIGSYKELQQLDQAIAAADKQYHQLKSKLRRAAENLTEIRCKKALHLSEEITKHIRDLAMPNGKLLLQIDEADDFLPTGKDIIHFLFSANLGEPLNALEKVASGGELSRIALAYKTVLLDQGNVPTMVFDEIDTGVGGITAQRMAEKLAIISRKGQVLCITHLPQIAAFADNHLYIEKSSSDGRTATRIRILESSDRAAELVRMAGGNNSKAAAANAAEQLALAQKFKLML